MTKTTKINHTPGPWEFDETGDYMTYPVIRNNGMVVARVLPLAYPSHGDLQANGRLIAAAPEMLEIIRSLASPGINHGESIALLARLEDPTGVLSTVPEPESIKPRVWALYCENAGYGIAEIVLYATKEEAEAAEQEARKDGIEETRLQEVPLP